MDDLTESGIGQEPAEPKKYHIARLIIAGTLGATLGYWASYIMEYIR